MLKWLFPYFSKWIMSLHFYITECAIALSTHFNRNSQQTAGKIMVRFQWKSHLQKNTQRLTIFGK